MNIARVIITDRGDKYLPDALESMDEHVKFDWSATVTVDDREHELGMAGAVREAWKQLPKNTDYVFHMEEDWLFTADVDVEAMCHTIDYNTHLAQMTLKRGPGNPVELEAGGMVEACPDEYKECSWWPTLGRRAWLEHKRCFSLNPGVYPYWLTTSGVPDPKDEGVEKVLTDRFLAQGLVFGVWGGLADPPMVAHIGWERAAGWRF